MKRVRIFNVSALCSPGVWCLLLALWVGAVRAEDWTIHRFEGRDYVSLENIASFYGFPPPPRIEQPPATPAPATEKAADGVVLPAPVAPPAPPRTVTLDNGKWQLAVTPNTREAEINGVKQWLAFPAHVQDGRIMVSRLDLSKSIEPRLRPDKVDGLRPVETIVLDPGHGGHDRGAISRYGAEKDFALDVALRARDLLEKQGRRVVMTRSADIFIPLHERPAVANRIPNSVFVSIHFNSTSTNPLARGFEIFSLAPRGAPATNDGAFSARDLREEPGNAVDTPSTVLAGTIFHSLLGNVPMVDRGTKHARFAVLRLCTVPATLVECGFVSNSAESALIGSPAWRQQLAQAIVAGIENYKELAEQRQLPKMVADYRRAAGSGIGLPSTPTP
jgi:N-acetylmuramoyl-L-alanine amidase